MAAILVAVDCGVW